MLCVFVCVNESEWFHLNRWVCLPLRSGVAGSGAPFFVFPPNQNVSQKQQISCRVNFKPPGKTITQLTRISSYFSLSHIHTHADMYTLFRHKLNINIKKFEILTAQTLNKCDQHPLCMSSSVSPSLSTSLSPNTVDSERNQITSLPSANQHAWMETIQWCHRAGYTSLSFSLTISTCLFCISLFHSRMPSIYFMLILNLCISLLNQKKNISACLDGSWIFHIATCLLQLCLFYTLYYGSICTYITVVACGCVLSSVFFFLVPMSNSSITISPGVRCKCRHYFN